MPSEPPTPTRERTVDLGSGMHPILNDSQQLTTTDFLLRFQHQLGMGTNTPRGTASGAISLHTPSHASTPHYGSSPPRISTPPASSTYPPICSPTRAMSPSASVNQCHFQYGKGRQVNSSSLGSAYSVSARLPKPATSIGQSPPSPGTSTLLLASSPPHIHVPPTPASSPSMMASHMGGTTATSQIGRGPVVNVKFYGLPPVTQYYKGFSFEIPHTDSPPPFYCVTKGRCVGVIATW